MRFILGHAVLWAALAISLPQPILAQGRSPILAGEIVEGITLRRLIHLEFDQSASDIFPKLLTRVDLYDPNIVEVRFEHDQSQNPGRFGVGTRRICIFADGRELVEPLVAYDPPHSYGYTVDADRSTMSLPVSDIVLLYAFQATDDGATDLTVQAYYDPRIPGTGPVIEPVLTGTLRRTFQTAVDVFGGTYLGDEKP